ncbi:MAG: hypothetical protein GXO29_07950 [Thermotogae bacterium]|nr:hypothetical protein [Thermotogota bacterium]
MIKVVGIPFETEANFLRGSALAPSHVRWHLWGIDEYSPLFGERMPEYEDVGDVWTSFDLPPSHRLSSIENRLSEYIRNGDLPLFIGGDHTITWATARALREMYGEFAILHLDAHLDRWDDYGGRFSHATVMRRLEEEGFEVGTFGYRTVGAREYLPRHGSMYDLSGAYEFALGHDRLFLSLDLDVLDPSEFPCVSNPEPMGVKFGDVLNLLKALRGKLLGAEMVEYLPTLDCSRRCGSVAAIMMRELLLTLKSHPST